MLKNHLVVALRHLRRERGYALLNVAGLAVGLACCVLIVLYVRDELAYDRHHEKAERVFRVTRPTAEGSHWAPVGPPVGPALAAAFPEVEAVARVFPLGDGTVLGVADGDDYHRFEAPGGAYADSTVFEVFTLPLVAGDPATALDRPGAVVLSASMAARLFGGANPLGRTVGLRGPADLTVTGVLADLPETTHLPLEYLVSMRTYYDQEGDWLDEATTWAGFYTYVLLRRPGDAAALAAKLPGFVDTFLAGDYDVRASTQTELRLQPLTAIHLHSKLEKEYRPNGDALYVAVFGVVAVFVLVIACVNFVNLTTARSGNRLREVGVRKALGSTRGQLARQFLAEALVTSLAALGLAYGLVALALPLLNGLTGKTFALAAVHTPPILLGLLGLALATGLLAGLYPALYMAGFAPTRALRNDPSRRQPLLLRRGLVVFQFALSIFMLAGTAVVFSQLHYVRTKALGFDKERVVEVRLDRYAAFRVRENLEGFRAEVTAHTAVAGASLASDAPGERYSLEQVTVEGRDEEQVVRIAWGVDHAYARTLGLSLAAGRDFSERVPADTAGWLVNAAAARALGLERPVGTVLRWGEQYAAPIVGVVEDFHFASLHAPIEPLVIPLRPGVGNTLLVRVRDEVPAALAHVRARLDALVPGAPFRYTFLDDAFDRLYRAEERLSRVFGVFAGLAVFIACLGLFGLAAYAAERRRKEIGVRKVLGATVGSVVALLSKEFVRLVALAFAVAAPLAYLVMSRWLEGFAYRVELGAGVFLLAGGLALAIALLTVGYHALRAATADPVEALRYE